MKLIVQIPCYNEAENIAEVIAAIPREIDGVDEVAVMIIDDGSSDDTVAIAKAAGPSPSVLTTGSTRAATSPTSLRRSSRTRPTSRSATGRPTRWPSSRQ